MSTEPDHLKPFLNALARVAPDPGRLDRDALLFDAGRRAGRAGPGWPLTAAALALVSAGLTGMLTLQPPRVVEVERVVYLSAPAPLAATEPAAEPVAPAAPSSPEWLDGLRLRQRVAREGVNALSQTTLAAPPASRDDLPDISDLRLNAPSSKGDLSR
jgi:hypothetical protein